MFYRTGLLCACLICRFKCCLSMTNMLCRVVLWFVAVLAWRCRFCWEPVVHRIKEGPWCRPVLVHLDVCTFYVASGRCCCRVCFLRFSACALSEGACQCTQSRWHACRSMFVSVQLHARCVAHWSEFAYFVLQRVACEAHKVWSQHHERG